MYNVQINCFACNNVTIEDIKEIRCFISGDLKKTFTVNEFSSFSVITNYYYNFISTNVIFSVSGENISNVYFFVPEESDDGVPRIS